MTLIDRATRRQREAADPSASAWAAANAGSGKTRVLTDRVVRLLLAEADPSAILCVTYTKAAASEMEDRLFKTLGRWALKDDDDLRRAIHELTGEEAPGDRARLDGARRLFAQALETPGGLKIQTIHAFCESVLRRFPLEAGAPPGFRTIDDREAERLRAEAILSAVDGRLGADVAAAAERLYTEKDPERAASAIRDLVEKRREIEARVAREGGEAGYDAALAATLGADPDWSEADALSAAVDFDDNAAEATYSALLDGGKTDASRASELRRAMDATSHAARLAALAACVMTGAGAPRSRKSFPTQAVKKAHPSAAEWLYARQDVVAALLASRDAHRTWRLSVDAARVGRAVGRAYDDGKRRASALDYADLVEKTAGLFRAGEAAWALYKLDRGLDHVLLDEAQDTGPDQWTVLGGLIEEFFAGEGAAEDEGRLRRTVFAVGDEKQSIYSFQGADVALFSAKQKDLYDRAAAARRPFRAPEMITSFRSTPPVLEFVDAAFDHPDARDGVASAGSAEVRHEAAREGGAGRVELWPLEPRPEKPEPEPWSAPVDAPPPDDPAAALGDRIARTISGWIAGGAMLESRGRPIRPSDVLVLVQKRGAEYWALTRSLIAHGVAVEGADRIDVLDDVAVQDLLSLARFALQPSDDLSLAEVLRGPLGELTEDDLYRLAQGRRGRLIDALRDAAKIDARVAETARRIDGLSEGAARLSPFDFFTRALDGGDPTGRALFARRLGEEFAEPVAALLNLALEREGEAAPSLDAFLKDLSAGAGSVKRELSSSSTGGVRVMTAHGAKGLEAEIVFLADAARCPRGPTGEAPIAAVEPGETAGSGPVRDEGLFFVTVSGANDPPAVAAAKDRQKRLAYEEYRRLFYVAATRAMERLYVCGVAPSRKKDQTAQAASETTWYGLAAQAFERLPPADVCEIETETGGAKVFSRGQSAPPDAERDDAPRDAPGLPAWARTPPPPDPAARRVFSPSRLLGEEDETEGPLAIEAPSESPRAPDRYTRGAAIHALLEHLPGVAPAERLRRGGRFLAGAYGGFEEAMRAAWLSEAVGVLEDEAFAAVFAPDALAEAPIAGRLDGGVRVQGVIDRLVVGEREILCVDYKTNRPPPARAEDVPAAYLAQMGAYRALLGKAFPGRPVKTALLWTFAPRLMALPDALVDHALATALAPRSLDG